jgi:hypothetical protein
MDINKKLNSLTLSEMVEIWEGLEGANSDYTVFGMGLLEARMRIGDLLKEELGRLFLLDQMEQEEREGDGGFSTACILSNLRDEMRDEEGLKRHGEWILSDKERLAAYLK